MRAKQYVYRLLGAVCAFATIACVDQSFDLNNVSTEVTVGSGTTTLPLGYLNDKSLGELLEGNDIEGLHADENGDLSYRYAGESETIDIEGITTEFDIPEVTSPFIVEYPDFEVNVEDVSIEAFDGIDITGLEAYSGLGTSFSVPGGITVSANYSKVFEGEDYHIAFDVPEQVASIDKIYFANEESGHIGTPLHVHIDFNGVAAINGGGKLTYNFGIEGGSFRLLDENGEVVCDGTSYGNTHTIEPDAEYVEFVVYLESISNYTAIDENHRLDIPLKLTFDMGFEFTTKAGTANLSALPKINFEAELAYGDAEVTMDADHIIAECIVEDGYPIVIDNLPAELKMLNRVGMKPNMGAMLDFYIEGMEWLGDDMEDVEVVAKLPECLKLYYIDGENYTYDAAANELTTTVEELSKGIVVGVEALDFGTEGLVPEDGKIALTLTPSIVTRFKEDAHINISSLQHKGNLNLTIGIAETIFTVESLSGKVDYTYDVEQAVELEGLSDINLEINGVGLKPIIEVNVTHPLTVAATLSGSVVPSANGAAVESNTVAFSDVALPSATFVNGEIAPAEVTLIIADESLRANYADDKYTFVACDVTKLLLGSLPEALDVKLQLGVDADKVQTLYIDEEFAITYDYSLNIPFAVDETLDVRYSDEISGLGETFAELAEYDIKVGDIAVIATVSNSTPLQFGAEVTLKDGNGNPTAAQLTIADDAIIEGSADGTTPKVSTLRFELDLGADGRVANITEVDAIAFELMATSAAINNAVPLNTNQTVGVKLQLELAGGITIDIDEFISEE